MLVLAAELGKMPAGSRHLGIREGTIPSVRLTYNLSEVHGQDEG